MPFVRSKGWGEIIRRLIALQERIVSIYEALGYERLFGTSDDIQDVRAVTLLNYKDDLLLNTMLLNILVGVEQNTVSLDTFRSMTGLHRTSAQDIPRLLERLEQYLRLSLATTLQFRTENLTANILSVLKNDPLPNLFSQKAKLLLGLLSVGGIQRDVDLLSILQLIRDCLHNNGYHYHQTMEIEFDGFLFVFESGSRVTCAGWDHVALGFEATLLVVEKILNHEKVKAIREPIHNYFLV
jgi:hypothetical protein